MSVCLQGGGENGQVSGKIKGIVQSCSTGNVIAAKLINHTLWFIEGSFLRIIGNNSSNNDQYCIFSYANAV